MPPCDGGPGSLILGILLLLFSTLPMMSCQQYVTWYEEHQLCTLHIPSAHHLVTQQFSKGGGQWTLSPTKSVRCKDQPYVAYFQDLITHSSSEYHKQIATEVLSLYRTLAQQRQPTVLDTTLLSKYFPKYAALARKEPKKYDSQLKIFPLNFGIPSTSILPHLPLQKTDAFGRVIPGNTSTYFRMHEEAQYFANLRDSLFVFTWKKGGWDCLRHYELLANGALPLFVDIAQAPTQALRLHPKKLYELLLRMPGVHMKARKSGKNVFAFDELYLATNASCLASKGLKNSISQVSSVTDVFDYHLYRQLTAATLQYTHNVFSTERIAEYVLETVLQHQHHRRTSSSRSPPTHRRTSEDTATDDLPPTHSHTENTFDANPAAPAQGTRKLKALSLPLEESLLSSKHGNQPSTQPQTQTHTPADHSSLKKPLKILYLTHKNTWDMDRGDYMTDFFLHGLLTLLDPQSAHPSQPHTLHHAVVDFPSRDPLYKRLAHLNDTTYWRQRQDQYGMGFSFGLQLDRFVWTIERDMQQLRTQIRDHVFDLVIMGSMHREGWASTLFLWEEVCASYAREDVVGIDGGDVPISVSVLERFVPCVGLVFSREGFVPGVSDV